MSSLSAIIMNSNPLDVKNADLRACRGCLDTEMKLHYFHTNKFIAQIFGEFTNSFVANGDDLPQYICSMCVNQLIKFNTFQKKCRLALHRLREMQTENQLITIHSLKSIDRNDIRHNLIQTPVATVEIQEEIEDKEIEDYINDIDRILDKEIYSSTDDEINLTDDKTVVKRKNKSLDEETVNDVRVKQEHCLDNNINISYEVIDEDFLSESDNKNETMKLEDNLEDENFSSKIHHESKLKNKRNNKRKVKKEKFESVTLLNGTTEENCVSTNAKRKSSRRGVTELKNKAEEFSKAYNVEVTFFSKKELLAEMEERRKSDSYRNAAFKCELCCKVFLVQETYTRHKVVHDPSNGDYECEICHNRYNSKIRVTSHYRGMHERKFTCNMCGLVSRFWTAAKSHFLWHEQGKKKGIKCELCGMQFALKNNYLIHMRNKHGEGGTRCLLCERVFNGAFGLKVHMDRFHKKAARCDICQCVFDNAEVLSAHAQGRCRKGISACPTCGVNFVTENEMRSHYDEQHKKTLLCTQCNKSFDNEDKYLSHTRWHQIMRQKSVKNKKPDEDGNSETMKMRNGIFKSRLANGADKFVCEVCGKASTCYAKLRYHQRVHTGEKPYQCDICQKSFRVMAALTIHIATHTDERKYKCTVCSKAFRQQAHRTAHMLTHTKERPYSCLLCPKRYSGQSALKDHNNTAHLGLPPRKWVKTKNFA